MPSYRWRPVSSEIFDIRLDPGLRRDDEEFLASESENITARRARERAAFTLWALLDHPVRAHEDRLWNREADRLGGLEVDDQLELRGLLYR